MKSIILSSMILGSVLYASSDLDHNKMNESLSSFNAKHQFDMKVIDSTKLGADLYFVVVGDLNQSKFMNIIVSKNADVAIAPAQIVPLKEGKEWDEHKSNLEKMIQAISKDTNQQADTDQPTSDLLKPLSIAFEAVEPKNIFYFNGAKGLDEFPVYIVDPLCPSCQSEMKDKIMKEDEQKKPFAILPIAGFGDKSIDSVVYLLSKANGDFKSFAKTFADANEKKATDETLKAMIYKTSETVFSTGLVNGIPLRFEYKKTTK